MSNNEVFMLTTFDNPFNPFDDFETWWKEDIRLGHDCSGLLARKALTSSVASDSLNRKAIDDAMNEIVEQNPFMYRKVSRANYSKRGIKAVVNQ